MNDLSERIIVGIGRALGRVADLLPGGNDDWCERDYERAVRRVEEYDDDPFVSDSRLRYAEDGGEALEPIGRNEVLGPYQPHGEVFAPRTADSLGPDERDAEWVSTYGARWRWKNDRWETLTKGTYMWAEAPVGYTPQASGPFTAVEEERMDWRGWAVPAILEVLADDLYGAHYVDYDDWLEWAEHVAPLIADRIACDPQRAIAALQTMSADR